MTDEEIRIAVAECCGAVWKRQSCTPWNPDDDSRNVYFRRLYFIDPGDIRGPATLQDAFGNEAIADDHDHLPNYPADLNACASFEATLTTLDKQAEYRDTLMMAVGLNPHYWEWQTANEFCRVVFATARQRCEAFLRVKGLWKP